MTWGDYVVPIFNLSLNCIELWTSRIGFGNFDLDSLSIFFAKRLMGSGQIGEDIAVHYALVDSAETRL
jgi:hypothetical protein